MSRRVWFPRWLALALGVVLVGLVAYFGFFSDTRIFGQASCEKESSSPRQASDRATSSSTTIARLDDGLVGYWRFDGDSGCAMDSSGNANDGVFVNSGVVRARFGEALELKARKNSHVSIPATPSSMDFADQLTVSAWVFPEKPPAGFKVVVSRQIGTLKHPDQFYLGFGKRDGITHYKWHLGTIDDGTVSDRAIYVGSPVSGRWIHMAGVYDGETMRLYVDGVEIGRTAQIGKVQVDENPITIGAEENGTESLVVNGEFAGMIDEVRIYNRALSPGEIKEIYELPLP